MNARGIGRGPLVGQLPGTVRAAVVDDQDVYVGAGLAQREKDADAVAASNLCLRIVPDSAAGYEVAWKAKKATCHYVSPLVHRGHAYYLNQAGVLFCLDAKTGEEAYAKRTSGPCWAEPIACGGHVYLFHKDGRTTVVKAGPRYEAVGTNRLWKEGSPPLPGRSYDYEPTGPKDPRRAKPPAHYLDPLVYGAAAVDGAFFVRLGTRLYCVAGTPDR